MLPEWGKLINGDCIEGMKKLDDKCVDYVFTSPPYNRKRNDRYAKFDDIKEEYFSFLVDAVTEMLRICKHHVFLNIMPSYYNRADVYKLIGHFSDKIQQIVVWQKLNPLPSVGTAITNAYELFLVLGDKALKGKQLYTRNIVSTNVNTDTTSEAHKAVMAQEVAEWFFDSFIPPESTIIDPFMGLGTTAVVAESRGCKWTGFEIVPEYCYMAESRIQKQSGAREVSLFDYLATKKEKKTPVLDVACGSKMFYFDKNDERVTFCDKREMDTTLCDGRKLEIHPDYRCDFTNLPFDDESYKLVVFDPPHLIGDSSGWQKLKYGFLEKDNWKEILSDGFSECFRVLQSKGVLVFKWNETDIPVSEVLKCTDERPIFGHKSGKLNKTHWLCFMKE